MAKRPGRGRKPPAGLSQEDVAARVPCAQATVSKFDRRGWLTHLKNGRLAESAVEEMRARMTAKEEETEGDPGTKRRLELAMTRLREAQAKLRENEVERQSGKFIERAEVERDCAELAERIIAVLRAIGARVALSLECPCRRAAVVKAKIEDEIERAIAQLHESKWVKPPADEGQ